MPVKDLHCEPFDKATLLKLEIFERYLEAWLPVFIHNSRDNEVVIFDFFAGSGKDSIGQDGSPLRILKKIKEFQADIFRKHFSITVKLNELEEKKFIDLRSLVEEEYSKFDRLKRHVKIEYFNQDFCDLFLQQSNLFFSVPSLLFFDQNGIKYIDNNIIKQLESFYRSDFLFFIASSILRRFSDDPNIQTYHPDLDVGLLKNAEHRDIHRFITLYYRSLLSKGSELKIYPFTIKKDYSSNIYGLIFGSKHPLGVSKFLEIAWEKNKLNGEANFDIDDDMKKDQGVLFGEKPRKKVDLFKKELTEYILWKKEISNKEIFDFTLERGHLPSHAVEVLKSMRKNKQLAHFSYPYINYENCYRLKNIVHFKVVNNE